MPTDQEAASERERIALERERLALEREQAERAERQKKEAGNLASNVGGDDGTSWIIMAIIIFFLDMFYIPILGDKYSGFTFAWWTVSFDLFLMVVTSGLFTTFLLINILIRFFYKEFSFVPLLIIFFILNYSGRFFGYTFDFGTTSIYIGIAVIVLLFLIFKFFAKKEGFLSYDDLAYLLFAFVYSFFILNTGWIFQPKAIIHFVFITMFGFFFIRGKEKGASSWYYWTMALLLLDFFGYNLLKQLIAFRYVPFLPFFVVFYIRTKIENTFADIVAFVLFAVMILVSLDDVRAAGGFGWVPAEKPLSLTERVTGVLKGVTTIVERQLVLATGGLYKSRVEQNQFEPLGVFFDRVRASQPRYYNDEDVTLWATIKSRTLSDPVDVNFTCYRWDDNRKRIKADKEDLIPKESFTVYTLEDKDVECTFKKHTFKAGTQIVTLSAIYNFVTSAYQKVYFIDRDRQRAMVRENLDPLKEFGITEKNPEAVFTNGPVQIAVSMQNLVPVSDDIEVKPALGISLANRDKIADKQGKPIGKWEGKIKKINELVVVLPDGVELDGASCKPVKFKDYAKEDCDNYCKDVIYVKCSNVNKCDTLSEPEKTKCQNDCVDAKLKCNEECNAIFKADSGEISYKGYQLDIKELETKYKDQFKDIDKNREFVCRILPKRKVLENVPITTKFIRIRTKYDYLVENTFNVIVEQAPTPISQGEIELPFAEYETKITKEKYAGILFDSKNKNEIRYSPYVLQAAEKYNVNYLFAKAIIQKESTWNPKAIGDGGKSIGLMQVKRETASRIGCLSDWYKNPVSNIDCGVKYIRLLIDYQKKRKLKEGLRYLAGGYNGGEGAMEYSKQPGHETETIWENPNNAGYAGTRGYVEKVMEYYNKMAQQIKSDTSPPPITEEIVTLTNRGIAYEPKEKKVIVTWDTSPNPDVKKYLITKYKQGYYDKDFETTKTTIEDSNVQQGVDYSYYISAVDDNYYEYASAEVQIIIPSIS